MEIESQNILLLIQACKDGNRAAQNKLYQLYYSYGMSVCLRYTSNRHEAQEVLNDGFFKVFSKIDQYDTDKPFKKWFRVILMHAAIDHHRKYHKHEPFAELGDANNPDPVQNDGWDNLVYEEVLECVQELPPQYRLVFNLFAIEELGHQEIAEKLGISVGTSKSNYFKAKKKLIEILRENGHLKFYQHG